MVLQIINWVVLALSACMVISGIIWMRRVLGAGGNITYATLCSNAFYFLSLAGILVTDYSPLHLVWLFVASFVAGFLTLVPPFSMVLIPIGKLYGNLCSVGLRKQND